MSSDMQLSRQTLIIPEKADVERDGVASVWTGMGGQVMRIGRFWDPPPSIVPSGVTLYGNDTFCLVLEQKLGLRLISPPDDLIKKLDHRWLKREVSVMLLKDAAAMPFPRFIKPIVPKQFKAAVYHHSQDLIDECIGLEPDTEVMVSSIVEFKAEARSFILNGSVLDVSVYEDDRENNEEDDGDVRQAAEFIRDFCRSVVLPENCVIDVGRLDGHGWVFIEANASWGAGLNGCTPEKVLPAICKATALA